MPGISNNNPFELLAVNAEKEDESSFALCMTSWHLPVHKQSISYKVSSTRKASAIEEYIMKAASLELPYDIDKTMLSEILGLDEVFTDNALSHLCDKGILDKEKFPVLKLTETGKNLLNQGMVLDKEQDEEINYYINLKTGHVYAKPTESGTFPIHSDYTRIEKMTENIKKYINRKFIKDVNVILGSNIENATITEIVSAKTSDAVQTLFTEILMFNANEDKSYIKIWDHAAGCFRDDIAKLLEKTGAKPTYEHDGVILSNRAKDMMNSPDEIPDDMTCNCEKKYIVSEELINTIIQIIKERIKQNGKKN